MMDFRFRELLALVCTVMAAGCAAPGTVHLDQPADAGTPARIQLLNRVSWGVSGSLSDRTDASDSSQYLTDQLHARGIAPLPAEAQRQIAMLTISQTPLDSMVFDLEQRRKDADAIKDDDQKKAAQQAYQQELNRIAREAASRSILRAVYSPNQLQEQMTWFWMNHFNVFQNKANIRVLVGDYEEQIRAHALGRFRDLLEVTSHHPAMIRYLDNEQNAAGHINENYARELMELHTLGVNGGYTQKDVQELARIFTGVGINLGTTKPAVKPALASQYVRNGLFEFNPNRHDYGDKVFLGVTVKGRGLPEVESALDRLASSPATAHFVSRKLAMYFVRDDPSAALVDQMSQTFLQSDGDIAATLATLFDSPEFVRSLGTKFKDPMHYVVSAVRLAYDDKVVLNVGPMLGWLNRMGEPLYGHETPDGYPLVQSAWASPGQMTTRFEIAKAIGSGNAGLFKTDGPEPVERAAFPQLANALYYKSIQSTLGAPTRRALDQATSPQEWNSFLLSSPEFMNR